MLKLLLIRFWPVFIPVIIYLLWQLLRRRKAKQQEEAIPRWLEGPWAYAVATSLLIGIGCFLWFGLMQEHRTGSYQPTYYKGGQLIRGGVDE